MAGVDYSTWSGGESDVIDESEQPAVQWTSLETMLRGIATEYRNAPPILRALKALVPPPGASGTGRRVVEFAAGTAEHATFFTQQLGSAVARWTPTDMPSQVPVAARTIARARSFDSDGSALKALADPLPIEATAAADWQRAGEADWVFTSCSLHIMSWDECVAMLRNAGTYTLTAPGALLIMYGPFNINGEFTSPSNKEFDAFLRKKNPRMGIRDLGEIETVAAEVGLELHKDYEMPENNRLIVLRRKA